MDILYYVVEYNPLWCHYNVSESWNKRGRIHIMRSEHSSSSHPGRIEMITIIIYNQMKFESEQKRNDERWRIEVFERVWDIVRTVIVSTPTDILCNQKRVHKFIMYTEILPFYVMSRSKWPLFCSKWFAIFRVYSIYDC